MWRTRTRKKKKNGRETLRKAIRTTAGLLYETLSDRREKASDKDKTDTNDGVGILV